ncbi:MAG: hypothetical protein V4714_08595 [Bacteroidota bacterium]
MKVFLSACALLLAPLCWGQVSNGGYVIFGQNGSVQSNNPDFDNPIRQAPNLQQSREEHQKLVQEQNRRIRASQQPAFEQRRAAWQETQYELLREKAAQQQVVLAQAEASQAVKQRYKQALEHLKQMLEGKKPLQVKEAVFEVEKTFPGNILPYAIYQQPIADWVVKMKRYALRTGQNFDHYQTRANLLCRFFADTIRLSSTQTHYPPTYDFNDPAGEKDYTHFFVSKLLRTNQGQCHSMPLLFKIIADEIGVRTHLSFSPSHSFIKIQDQKGYLYNFETTNGHFTSDKWVIASGYVKRAGIQSRIYLDTLSLRQTIVYCLNDLAQGYAANFGYDAFTDQCAIVMDQHHPGNIWTGLLYANSLTRQCQGAVQKAGYPPFEAMDNFPELKQLFDQRNALYAHIEQMGYLEIPPEPYADWLQSAGKETHELIKKQVTEK